MNSHSFLKSGDEQNHRYQNLFKQTENARQYEADSSASASKDKYLRSCALLSAQKGNYTEALMLLNQLIQKHPENAIDYNNRGLIYFQSGETQKAFRDYNIALSLNPNLASAYNNRANYYAGIGELVAALADYERALDLNPSHVRAWINRGITLRDLEQYEEAIDNFELSLLFGQLEAHILAERGRTYHLWGEWNCAVADYRRVLTILPSLATTDNRLSWRLRLQVEAWLDQLLGYH